MNRKEKIQNNPKNLQLFESLNDLHNALEKAFIEEYDRSIPFNELLIDRWQRAKKLGFGKKTSIYDNSLVIGEVNIGNNCWIGPFTILDGSGKLSIGDYCTISAGVHIYTHDNLKHTLSSGKVPIERAEVTIGSCSYIGPNTIVSKGLSIGNYCVIGAQSLVNKSIPDYAIVCGQPGRIVGNVVFNEEDIIFNYKK